MRLRSASHADAIREKASELIDEYQSRGEGVCVYNCAPPVVVECRMQQCFLNREPEP